MNRRYLTPSCSSSIACVCLWLAVWLRLIHAQVPHKGGDRIHVSVKKFNMGVNAAFGRLTKTTGASWQSIQSTINTRIVRNVGVPVPSSPSSVQYTILSEHRLVKGNKSHEHVRSLSRVEICCTRLCFKSRTASCCMRPFALAPLFYAEFASPSPSPSPSPPQLYAVLPMDVVPLTFHFPLSCIFPPPSCMFFKNIPEIRHRGPGLEPRAADRGG